MSTLQELTKKIENKEALIGIVGMGYVGLPLMLRMSQVGLKCLGIDIDESKITSLNNGESYIDHISSSDITLAREHGFEATSDFSRAEECAALIICVPTPLNKYREPDLSYVINTTEALVPHLRQGQIFSLESTTYPGTTEEELLPRLESAGLKVGEDVFLVYSPEREDPGNKDFSTQTIPKVVGGHTENCKQAGVKLYQQFIDKVVPVSSTKAAEMTKLLENIHRAVNIGLVNEMKIVADRMGIDIHEVVDAAATKPFGFTPYYPGPGLGGHCIPIDPFYLTWKAREYGLHTRFIELAGEVNTAMPQYVIDKLADALNAHGKSIKDSRILLLGVSYKKNIDDMRESPSMALLEMLLKKGASVRYSDPFVPHLPKMRKYNFDLSSIEISSENLKEFDCVLLATDHDKFDFDLIRESAELIIDTRGRYRQHPSPNIIKA